MKTTVLSSVVYTLKIVNCLCLFQFEVSVTTITSTIASLVCRRTSTILRDVATIVYRMPCDSATVEIWDVCVVYITVYT